MTTINRDGKHLLGRKVNMSFTEHVFDFGKEKTTHKQYKIEDPEFLKEVDELNSNNRVFPPGTMGTMDHKPQRLNVYVNEDGIVIKVKNG